MLLLFFFFNCTPATTRVFWGKTTQLVYQTPHPAHWSLLRIKPYPALESEQMNTQQLHLGPRVPGAGSLPCGNHGTGVVRGESRLRRMEVERYDGATGCRILRHSWGIQGVQAGLQNPWP